MGDCACASDGGFIGVGGVVGSCDFGGYLLWFEGGGDLEMKVVPVSLVEVGFRWSCMVFDGVVKILAR